MNGQSMKENIIWRQMGMKKPEHRSLKGIRLLIVRVFCKTDPPISRI